MIYMIKITDSAGVEHNVNLDYVVQVSLPSGENKNELIQMSTGVYYRVLAGTWEAAIAALFAEFDDNPQPMPNVKDKVFIVL